MRTSPEGVLSRPLARTGGLRNEIEDSKFIARRARSGYRGIRRNAGRHFGDRGRNHSVDWVQRQQRILVGCQFDPIVRNFSAVRQPVDLSSALWPAKSTPLRKCRLAGLWRQSENRSSAIAVSNA